MTYMTIRLSPGKIVMGGAGTRRPWVEAGSALRLAVFRVVERLVPDRRHLHRIAFAEILDLQLAPFLAMRPGQIGQRDILADRRAIGDRARIGTPPQFIDQRLARFGV